MTYRPIISSLSDLTMVWRHLLAPLVFDSASLWMLLIDADDRAVPVLVEISDPCDIPEAADIHALADLVGEALDQAAEPGARVAFLLSRPGRGEPTNADHVWAEALTRLSLPCGVEVTHLAAGGGVRPLAA